MDKRKIVFDTLGVSMEDLVDTESYELGIEEIFDEDSTEYDDMNKLGYTTLFTDLYEYTKDEDVMYSVAYSDLERKDPVYISKIDVDSGEVDHIKVM